MLTTVAATSLVLAIPSGPLKETLDVAAAAAGFTTVYDMDIGEIRTAPVRFVCSSRENCPNGPVELVRNMLQGTGLNAAWLPGEPDLGRWVVTIYRGPATNYCYPWMGAHAPLPPCTPPPQEIRKSPPRTMDEVARDIGISTQQLSRLLREQVRPEKKTRDDAI